MQRNFLARKQSSNALALDEPDARRGVCLLCQQEGDALIFIDDTFVCGRCVVCTDNSNNNSVIRSMNHEVHLSRSKSDSVIQPLKRK